MHDVFYAKRYKCNFMSVWIGFLFSMLYPPYIILLQPYLFSCDLCNIFSKSSQSIFLCSTDVGLSHITCFVQWNVGRSESGPAQSQGFKRHHVLVLSFPYAFVIHHKKYTSQGAASPKSMKGRMDLSYAGAKTSWIPYKLKHTCRSVKVNTDVIIGYWVLEHVCVYTDKYTQHKIHQCNHF